MLQFFSQPPILGMSLGVQIPLIPASMTEGRRPFVGHTFMHLPQRMQRSRKPGSGIEPGGLISLPLSGFHIDSLDSEAASMLTPNTAISCRLFILKGATDGFLPYSIAPSGHSYRQRKQLIHSPGSIFASTGSIAPVGQTVLQMPHWLQSLWNENLSMDGLDRIAKTAPRGHRFRHQNLGATKPSPIIIPKITRTVIVCVYIAFPK